MSNISLLWGGGGRMIEKYSNLHKVSCVIQDERFSPQTLRRRVAHQQARTDDASNGHRD